MDISHIYNKITHHHLYNSTVGDRQTRVAKVSKGLAQNRSCLGSDWDFWFLNCGAKPKKNTAVGTSRIIRKQLLVKLITNTFDLHGCRHTPLGQGRKSDRFLTCSSSLSCTPCQLAWAKQVLWKDGRNDPICWTLTFHHHCITQFNHATSG